jgi:hypothetical protein
VGDFNDTNYVVTLKKKRVNFVFAASLKGVFVRLLIHIRPVNRIHILITKILKINFVMS